MAPFRDTHSFFASTTFGQEKNVLIAEAEEYGSIGKVGTRTNVCGQFAYEGFGLLWHSFGQFAEFFYMCNVQTREEISPDQRRETLAL